MQVQSAIAAFILGSFLWFSTPARGQTPTTGQISGVILDPQGAGVGAAEIKVSSEAGLERSTSSGATGHYALPLLAPGAYRLEVEKVGFSKAIAENVIVRITETTNLDIRLKLAAQSASIEVKAAPPLVDTENAARGTVIEQDQIRQLPLPTRNFQQLLTLTPGTSGPVQNSSELGRGAAPIYVDGVRATSNSVIINGVDANSIGTGSLPNLAVPAADSLQEFIVQTSQYDASQGRVAGGIVAAVTKSGTNQFHGNLYEFLRNDALNANNFFLNAGGVPRPPYKRNQFGGTLGGPLSKDRLWLFISYQGTRETNGTSLTNSIGTAFVPADLSNDRSEQTLDNLAKAYGAPACAALPNLGCLVASNPTADTLLKATLANGNFIIPSAPHPIANPGTRVNTVAAPVVGISKYQEDQFNTNLDYQFSAKNRLSAKFFWADNPETQALFNLFGLTNPLPVPGFGANVNFNDRLVSVTDTHVISSSLLNDFRFGYSSISTASHPQEPFTAAQLGITTPLQKLFPGMPEISVFNDFDLGASPFSDNFGIEKTYTVGDTLSWQKGRHNLKFGAEYKHHDINFTFNLYNRGQIFFLGLSGDPFGDFLGAFAPTDIPLTSLTVIGSGVNNRDNRAQDWAGFVNDEWRLTDRLTLTLGLRYDFFGSFTEAQGRYVGFDPTRVATVPLPAPPFPAGTVAVTGGFVQASNAETPLPGVPEIQSSLVPPDRTNFAPRLGFAWQPLASSNRFVVRGGYGIYYDRSNARLLNNQLLNFPYFTLAQASGPPISFPFVAVPPPSAFPLSFNNPAIFPFGAGPPALLPAAVVGGVAVIPATGIYPDIHDFRTPFIQQYSLGIQYEFARSWMLDLSYVGSVGRKEYRLVDFNQQIGTTPPGLPGPLSYGLSSLAVQGFGVHAVESSGNSNYNSLQAGVTKQFSHGLQFLAAYTYGHSLDDYSGDPTGTSDITVVPGNQVDLKNHASSDFDRRHRLVFSGIYDLPTFYKGDSAFARQAANGWELATIFVVQSGTPFSVLTNATAFVQARADFNPATPNCDPRIGGSVQSKLNEYFNVACFVPATALGDFGDTGRNIIQGPNQKNVDISIIKFFPITERFKLEFRTELFNAFNQVSFLNPGFFNSLGNNLASTDVGKITATSTGPRVIQFALKLNF